jgi:methionyl-tRNA formyltransferase
MKYIFFGTPRFAEIVLEGLFRANLPPVALVCNPDRPVGRKKIITPPPTKVRAVNDPSDIDILQPETIDETFLQRLQAYEPDFAVVAAYAKILPQAALALPRLGTLGVHPSLLPEYRGASPIQSAILTRTTETGTTIYRMDEKMDHGPILAQAKLTFADETYYELEEKLAELSAQLLVKTIPGFLAGRIAPQPQDESRATFTKKFATEDGFVAAGDLKAAEQGDQKKANSILGKINAFNPEPGAWTIAEDGRRTKLLAAKLRDGALLLTLIQQDGEKPHRP